MVHFYIIKISPAATWKYGEFRGEMKFKFKVESFAIIIFSVLMVSCLYFFSPPKAVAKTDEAKISVTATIDSQIDFLMNRTELLSNPTIVVGTNKENGLGLITDSTDIRSAISYTSLNYLTGQNQKNHQIIASASQPLANGEVSLSNLNFNQSNKKIAIFCTGNF